MSHSFFFFFKQKTAYEMRISDWSSDVCSSDLQFGKRHVPSRVLTIVTNAADGWYVDSPRREPLFLLERLSLAAAGNISGERIDRPKIGRASCRERVGQYV